jgi:hypothetical protein
VVLTARFTARNNSVVRQGVVLEVRRMLGGAPVKLCCEVTSVRIDEGEDRWVLFRGSARASGPKHGSLSMLMTAEEHLAMTRPTTCTRMRDHQTAYSRTRLATISIRFADAKHVPQQGSREEATAARTPAYSPQRRQLYIGSRASYFICV